MSSITSYLLQIHNSVYGRDMRSAIYNAIRETFGEGGTYTDQFICTGGTLTGVILGNDDFHVNTSFGMAVFYHKDCTLQNAQLS